MAFSRLAYHPFGSSSIELVEMRRSRTPATFSTAVLDRLEPSLETNGREWMGAHR